MLFSLTLHWELPKPLMFSSACRAVLRYTVQKTRHSKSFERIAVQIDSGIAESKLRIRACAKACKLLKENGAAPALKSEHA